jgi:hypothetical protein
VCNQLCLHFRHQNTGLRTVRNHPDGFLLEGFTYSIRMARAELS